MARRALLQKIFVGFCDPPRSLASSLDHVFQLTHGPIIIPEITLTSDSSAQRQVLAVGLFKKMSTGNASAFTMLVVDDNRDFVEFLHLLLSHDGFAVRARHGRRSGDPRCDDAKLDGLAVCRELKQMRPSLETILLSAKNDISTRAEAIALGVSEFLTKSVNIEDL